MIAHAGLIARRVGGRWRGVLIEGPSGAGKSDLALRAVAAGWSLVADDRTLLWRENGRIWGRAPEPLGGLIEVRGLGILPAADHAALRPFVPVDLIVDCPLPGEVERLPDPASERLLDCDITRIQLAALEPSAPVKLAWALSQLAFDGKGRIKPPRPRWSRLAWEGSP
ncbi:MAG: HPr kinase/phosphorylase [Caulobacteraceae bacterium]|nr:HPr kinase/phosphorylase [Caulobacteraceae bacterium]